MGFFIPPGGTSCLQLSLSLLPATHPTTRSSLAAITTKHGGAVGGAIPGFPHASGLGSAGSSSTFQKRCCLDHGAIPYLSIEASSSMRSRGVPVVAAAVDVNRASSLLLVHRFWPLLGEPD